ncbi:MULTISPECIES: sulfite exporter TauE/SafE family protein [unclassified Cyanobium]|uniref:sulfite exporter TauE/SafE family protein n=1 Tax=unclassified Cyanobium TaxID=2627006 RepID=UPI0020CD35AB|nr:MULTISPECIES: sulfite exporter TauE/SafE family protein [unclassified Cyanobium]MCP9834988.1 sulfite exporter TauE/SafE family protein [Cyanobium sp. La Preciosa 7G6]MCP9937751.1 sulfite exporter TauE/SafE family protein [Cyanobium sp. Aljojuca 7A6]
MPLLIALAAVAFLYASVGHAGASGYIAVLALAGLPAPEIRAIALVLNVLVASVGTLQFVSAGHFRRDVFVPLALVSVPAALVGGTITLPAVLLRQLIGVVLLFSAWRLAAHRTPSDPEAMRVPRRRVVALTGATLGLLAGLTGTGGGIFLTPWMILRSWLLPKQAAAVSVAFILVNSIAGLAGLVLRQGLTALPDPGALAPLLVVVLIGGTLGAYGGSRRFPSPWIRRLLAVVLLIAAWKLLSVGA